MFVQVAYLHNILPCPRMLTRPSLFAASGPLRPSHQESPDPGPADPEPGHEGTHRCFYFGERMGGGLLTNERTEEKWFFSQLVAADEVQTCNKITNSTLMIGCVLKSTQQTRFILKENKS